MSFLNSIANYPKKMMRKGMRWYGSRKSFYQKYGNTLGPYVNERYLKYCQQCREEAESFKETNPGKSIVRTAGSVLVPGVMSGSEAAGLSDRISEILDTTDVFSKGSKTQPMMKRIDQPLSTFGRDVIKIFHHAALEQHILDFMGCNYRIEWLDCYRSFPTNQVGNSWLWHSDNVPVKTLKVMLHLTDAGEDQGATRFMDFADSRAYFEAGYRGDTSRRTEHLDAFAKKHHLPYRPFSHDAKAGDAMVFVNNALHRAVPPTSGYRDVLTYMILPNPIPWDRQLDIDGFARLERDPGAYPYYPTKRAA